MSKVGYRNVRIWDGYADCYIPQNSLTIENGLISSLEAEMPNSIDCAGLTVIPGLMDAHVHMTLDPSVLSAEEQVAISPERLRKEMPSRAERMVRAGITTARDLGGGQWLELELRDRINRGEIPGPRLLCAGQPVTSVKGHCWFWGGEAANAEDAIEVIRRQYSRNVDLIKIMATGGKLTSNSNPGTAQFTEEELREMISEANKLGYSTAAHCHGTSGITNASHAGITTIEHCSWMNENNERGAFFDEETARYMGKNEVFVSPTIYDKWSKFRKHPDDFISMIQNQFTRMRDLGVRLIASTDAGIPRVYHHDLPKALIEFAYFAVMTPVETLRTATTECAAALGISHKVGSISVGKVADLVFYDGNPLNDLSVLQSPVRVLARGVEVQLSGR